MIRLLTSLVILIVAANVAIAHCKHRNHEVFYPSPHNEHINIDDVLPKEINRHPHHHKGGRNTHGDDPVVHISVEYNDKGKLDIDENDRIKPIHKIIKKDLPDWLDENQDWIIRDNQKNRKHKNDWEIKNDDSDIWKKEIAEWDLKDTEHRAWENNKPYVSWDNKGVDYDQWNKNNNNNNGGLLDTLSNTNNNIDLLVPQIVYDRSGDKNALVELNDNINGFISNTTKSLGDNLHNLETDLLNVKVNFKPLLSLNTRDILRGDLNSDPITVKRKNENHLNNNWDRSDEYQKWLRNQHQNKWDNENSRGVVKDRVIKVHDDERETDWSHKQHDNKRWNVEPEWKYSSSDDVDSNDGGNGVI